MDRETRRLVLGGAVGLGAALFAHYELVTRHRYMREDVQSPEEQRKRNVQSQQEPEPKDH